MKYLTASKVVALHIPGHSSEVLDTVSGSSEHVKIKTKFENQQALLPAGGAGYLSGQDVPGLAGCVTICGLQGHGISCRDSKLNVHFRRKKVFSVQTFQENLLW